jgi:hypothetical protein
MTGTARSKSSLPTVVRESSCRAGCAAGCAAGHATGCAAGRAAGSAAGCATGCAAAAEPLRRTAERLKTGALKAQRPPKESCSSDVHRSLCRAAQPSSCLLVYVFFVFLDFGILLFIYHFSLLCSLEWSQRQVKLQPKSRRQQRCNFV